MVEIIGLGTMVALSWVLAVCMANEIDSEKRRPTGFGAHETEGGQSMAGIRRDAA